MAQGPDPAHLGFGSGPQDCHPCGAAGLRQAPWPRAVPRSSQHHVPVAPGEDGGAESSVCCPCLQNLISSFSFSVLCTNDFYFFRFLARVFLLHLHICIFCLQV
uniref:Uncharacterized protein n=1 Tax=Chrysemys picta bellii TaxID=8478 RepID=A0A8C3FD21_CHRPI